MLKNKFSIIVPIYNEINKIKETLSDIKEIYNQSNYKMEIILINDGSNDGTEKILDEANHDIFRVITHKENRGYGASLKTGINESKYETIVIIDADRTYPHNKIFELVDLFYKEKCDMVVGARVGKNVKIPLIRRPAKWFLNQLASYLAGLKIPDLNSGFRVMKVDVVKHFMNVLPDGFSFTTTITLAMLTRGYKVNYFPIEYFKRSGRSKIRPIHDTLNFLQLIIRTVIYFNPLKVFLPVSVTLFIIGFLLLAYRIFIARVFTTTITLLFIASFQILAIGMLADLIDKRLKD
jgi:glycosyltransferase involved in cell wall biosynthesis